MKFIEFLKRHPILTNFALIVLAFFVLSYAALYALDVFTEHGKTVTVPDVRNLQQHDARRILESNGFGCEITDSLYKEDCDLGAVVEQMPEALDEVKSGRTVYLTVNYSTPRMYELPNLVDYSERQGLSLLQGMGFEDVEVEYVASPFRGLILEMTVDGKAVTPGTRVLPTVKITLRVGNGNDVPVDSLLLEELDEEII